jgi:transposase
VDRRWGDRCRGREFDALYSTTGRPSIAPELLGRATLLQAFYSVRSERQSMEQIDYNTSR